MTIKEWYKNNFIDDELKDYLNDGVTFNDLYKAIYRGKDIYSLIGVSDSLIRERLFLKLADISDSGYSIIYDLWIGGGTNERTIL